MNIANGMKFVNDEQAIGKWEFFDVITLQAEFDPDKRKNQLPNQMFKHIYFLPNGEKYWIFEGWTKGFLLIHHGGDDPILCYKYSIKNINDQLYMFIEMTEDDKSYTLVMKKVSARRFTIFEIGRRENINIPFVNDDKIIGVWDTVAYVDNIEDFDGKISSERLWLEQAIFYPNGDVFRKYFDTEWHDKWSKGVLLDQKKSIASNYCFKTINGIEYMFLEWKMGNYVYGGMPPSYYVFCKKNIKLKRSV